MVNDLVTAIAVNLKEFQNIKVYTENIAQNLDVPCFLIKLINNNHGKSALNIHTSRPGIAVTYVGESNSDVNNVASILPYVLEKASYNSGSWIGHNIEITVDNEAHTLTATATYAEQMVVPVSKDKMQSYTQTQKVRG